MKLNATKREETGHTSSLRREGKLPAVVYGHHSKPVSLTLDGHEFQRVFSRAGRTHLIDLVIDSGRAHKVLIKEVQHHPRRDGATHVDFHQVSLKEKLHVEVPVITTGESPIVKRGDADLLVVLHAIRVECLPGDIPESIEVDISALGQVDDGVRISELKFPDGVTVVTDPEELIVKVTARRDMAAELDEEIAAEAPAEEPAAEEEGAAAEASEGGEGSEADQPDRS